MLKQEKLESETKMMVDVMAGEMSRRIEEAL